jgi:hypothetical protein
VTARGELELRAALVAGVERAYLTMTDQGEPGEEWNPETLEALAGAVADGAELKERFGDDALLIAIDEIRALGDMRVEVYAEAVRFIADDPD